MTDKENLNQTRRLIRAEALRETASVREPAAVTITQQAEALAKLMGSEPSGMHTAKVIQEARRLARMASNLASGNPNYTAHLITAADALVTVGSYPDARDVLEMARVVEGVPDEMKDTITETMARVAAVLDARLKASQAIHGKAEE